MGSLCHWEKRTHAIKAIKQLWHSSGVRLTLVEMRFRVFLLNQKYDYSLQRFVHHAASPKTRLVQQDLTKVSHVTIHGTLVTAKDNDNDSNMQMARNLKLCNVLYYPQ